jgi:hypothetical protein
MSTLNPTGAQSLAIRQLASFVARSAEFQEAAEAFNELDALQFVHYPAYRIENQQVRKPFAVVYEGRYSRRQLADGLSIGGGTLNLMLGINEENIDAPLEDEDIRFNNWQDAVITNVDALGQIAGGLNITGIEQTVPPTRSSPQHVAGLSAQMPFWLVEYAVTWDPIG